MGNSRSKVPAVAILKMADEDAEEKSRVFPLNDEPKPDHAEICRRLEAMGIDAQDISPAEAERCWRIASHKDFWRLHHAQHPFNKRAKTWMFVHNRFRKSSSSLVDTLEEIREDISKGTKGDKTCAMVTKVEKEFTHLVGKIASHSEFEDTQLFRFFREHFEELEDDIRSLEADHSDAQLEQNVRSSLEVLREGMKFEQSGGNGTEITQRPLEALAADTTASMNRYAESLEEHLTREERTLVGRWLNLGDGDYAEYRKYLKGKYRLVY